jgi:hypothetical protein
MMLEELRHIQKELRKVKTSLPKPLSKQVHNRTVKDDLKNIVDQYFRAVRPVLIKGNFLDTELTTFDLEMQELLQLSHTTVTAGKFVNAIKATLTTSVNLETICLTKTNTEHIKVANASDKKIIETLKVLLPSAAASYEQAVRDLQEPSRLSWRGPATDLREALRETLDHLAPDAEVGKQPGYKLEIDARGPTQKQKVRFILSKRGLGRSASATTEDAVSAIEEILGSFVRSIYARSSVSTHTPTQKDEVLRVRDFVRVALCELLEIPM